MPVGRTIDMSNQRRPGSLFRYVGQAIATLNEQLLQEGVLRPFSHPSRVFSERALMGYGSECLFCKVGGSLSFIERGKLLRDDHGDATL